MTIPATADQHLRLVGDEHCGVGINCRLCDRGGAPIAYYTHPDARLYEGTDVEPVHTITALIAAGTKHIAMHHAGRQPQLPESPSIAEVYDRMRWDEP